ncbi:M23 family metallopeptidase [Ruminococcaceae bacterium OttesenSCG-928-L11]|nr:M23 family metallopeptidase [Ruminococcaceae bacterium OttesenSCG-928-L11]
MSKLGKQRFSGNKFSRFMSSKGFYAAIAVCLAGAGLATWLAVDRTISGIEDSNSRILSNESSYADSPSVEEVEQKIPDIPKVSAPSSSSSMPSSSSAPSSKPEEPSKPAEAPLPSQSLVYTLPIKGDILSQFSNGELVKNPTLNDWRTHDGVDIAAEKGADIYVVADGVVTEIRKDALWGTVVTVSHADGKTSLYSGLSEIIPVKSGENVLTGQVIGKLEGIPCEMATGSHLHFAMKQNDQWIDPLTVMAQG